MNPTKSQYGDTYSNIETLANTGLDAATIVLIGALIFLSGCFAYLFLKLMPK